LFSSEVSAQSLLTGYNGRFFSCAVAPKQEATLQIFKKKEATLQNQAIFDSL
jgi:hypothetical protein